MPRRDRIKLSVGSGTLGKIVRGALALAGLVAFLLFVLGLIVMPLAENSKDLSLVAGGVLLGTISFFFTLYQLAKVRHAVWVDGTSLGERIFRTKWVNLATAEIDTFYTEYPQHSKFTNVHDLVARTRAGGDKRVTKLGLRISNEDYGADLPARDLLAVADAITQERERTGEGDRAFLIAGYLRRLAADPTMTLQKLDEPQQTTDEVSAQGEPSTTSTSIPEIPPEIDDDMSFAKHMVKMVAITVLVLGGIVVLGYAVGLEGLAIGVAFVGAVTAVAAVRQEFKRLRIWRQRKGQPARHRSSAET